ncbi:polysaccharide pyruvyl transferase family protein [Agromyces mediolanus]|uniref:polysaccharide pyruvyl transferase family protein n=1 Tax=Agromyces mediolanus TaxID=41986 RepID=UPI00383830D0
MRAVVLGDIGRAQNYHLGDEAMTEAAIAQLTARGVDQLTLAAVEPETARSFYGVPAVSQTGFAWDWPRERLEAGLARLTAELEAGTAAGALVEAVRSADFVLIAGGGNLTSEYPSHVFERVAFARIARFVGTPLLVTSQTVGPMLRERDRELVREIVDDAVVFGAREAASFELVRGLAADEERVLRTFDDGILLESDEASRDDLADLELGDRIVVASFAADRGTTAWSRADYIERVAVLLDELAVEFDAQVVLAPHTGSFDPANVRKDHAIGLEIAAAASDAVRALPTITAREYLALLERAMLSVSTRYHPTVFAPQLGIPTVGISMSYYSSVRMRGALGALGLNRFVVPAEKWDLVAHACREAVAGDAALLEHAAAARRAQSAWWDALVAAAQTGTWRSGRSFMPATPPEFVPEGAWSTEVETVTPLFEQLMRERVLAGWRMDDAATALRRAEERADEQLALRSSLERRIEALASARAKLEAELDTARGRRAVRLADAVGDVARRIRRRG